MTLTEPTKGTREWLRANQSIKDQLKSALKGVPKSKRRKLALAGAAGRIDLSDKAKQRLAARRSEKGA